ncbi:MAG: hypothetical protein ABW185_03010 [Sedimenticola sp.]
MAESLEYSDEEVKALVDSFKALGVKPKADTPEDLKAWMSDLVASGMLKGPKVEPFPHITPPPPPTYLPKISYFSGTSKDAEYDLWKYEVLGLVNGHAYPEFSILQIIRRAVKGEAARVLMNMGLDITVKEVLYKFDSCFGFVQEGQTILASFYNARQSTTEDVATFANRLEDMVSKAVVVGKVNPSQTNEMLTSALKAGINHELRVLAGFKFETCKNFDTLRVELRKLELECKQKGQCHSVDSNKGTSKKNDSPNAAIDRLTSMMKEVKEDISQLKLSNANPEHAFQQQQEQQKQPDQQQQQQKQQGGKTNYRGSNVNPNFRSYNRGGPNQQYQPHPSQSTYDEEYDTNYEVMCYRCGQYGHVQYGCRVILDHQRRGDRGRSRPLNRRGLMGRGRP